MAMKFTPMVMFICMYHCYSLPLSSIQIALNLKTRHLWIAKVQATSFKESLTSKLSISLSIRKTKSILINASKQPCLWTKHIHHPGVWVLNWCCIMLYELYYWGFWWLFASDSIKYKPTKVSYSWLPRYQQHTVTPSNTEKLHVPMSVKLMLHYVLCTLYCTNFKIIDWWIWWTP